MWEERSFCIKCYVNYVYKWTVHAHTYLTWCNIVLLFRHKNVYIYIYIYIYHNGTSHLKTCSLFMKHVHLYKEITVMDLNHVEFKLQCTQFNLSVLLLRNRRLTRGQGWFFLWLVIYIVLWTFIVKLFVFNSFFSSHLQIVYLCIYLHNIQQ